MNSLVRNWFNTTQCILMFFAALTAGGCGGTVNIGSDKCNVSACSALTKPDPAQCADGTQVQASGSCIKTADGACAWEVPTCNGVCTPGTTKRADDGCNQCACQTEGTWACTLADCDTSCLYQGTRYEDGAQFTSSEGCCQCSAGTVKCSSNPAGCNGSCELNGKTYANGASVPSGDSCNSCSCFQGQIGCTSMGCGDPTPCTESDCGAKPHSTPYVCTDGSTGGFTGQCLRDASGVCNWEIRTCPADPGFCTFEGNTYANGSLITTNNNCCACVDGNAVCRLTSAYCGNACIYDGKVYTDGESYPSTSSCNTCTCKNGESICTRNACTEPSACTPEECGGRPKCATYTCDDGSIAGCTDNCYRDSAGKCTWEVRTCPELTACTPDECGGKPDCGTITCDDGSIAGCLDNCYRNSAGKCAWEVRTCPAVCKAGEQKTAADGCNTCTCTSSGTWTCTAMACLCAYDGKLYSPGDGFTAVDGCNHCTCYSDGTVGCTLIACLEGCIEGDPGLVTGTCPACTIGADQTCNDDTLMSSLAGKCIEHRCSCNEGFGINPMNGKCTKVTAQAGSACTPNTNPSCNGNIEVSSYQGWCLFDGTCRCINNNVLDPSTGKCVHP
jgi:hypothetical protein